MDDKKELDNINVDELLKKYLTETHNKSISENTYQLAMQTLVDSYNSIKKPKNSLYGLLDYDA